MVVMPTLTILAMPGRFDPESPLCPWGCYLGSTATNGEDAAPYHVVLVTPDRKSAIAWDYREPQPDSIYSDRFAGDPILDSDELIHNPRTKEVWHVVIWKVMNSTQRITWKIHCRDFLERRGAYEEKELQKGTFGNRYESGV
jgi:hypothetical protein